LVVTRLLERLRGVRPGLVDVMRRAGSRVEPAHQLARHAAASGLVDGAAGLLADRLDLALATRRAAVLSYAACLRSQRIADAWRPRVGSFVRTGGEEVPAISPGEVIDFTLAATLDRHGAVGWGRPEPGGSTTKGSEARLVLPLAPSFDGADLVVVIELEARD